MNCQEMDSRIVKMNNNIEHNNNENTLTKIKIYIRGGICIDVQTTLPDNTWEYEIIDYDDEPELKDNHASI